MAIWAGSEFILIHNEAYRPILGARYPAAMGTSARAIWPEAFEEDLRDVYERGVPRRYEEAKLRVLCGEQHEGACFACSLSPIRDEDGHPIAVLNVLDENTRVAGARIDRKQDEELASAREEQQRFLLRFSDALRMLEDPIEIQQVAAQLLGEHLGAQRTLYAEWDGDDVFVHRDYVAGIPSMAGRYRATDFGSYIFLPIYRRGEAYVVDDVHTDPRLGQRARESFLAAHIAAFIGVGLVKHDRLVASFGVNSVQPRKWATEEVELARAVAERTWEAVERARAEVALRKSEQKYRTLFESIDEGFCIVEVLFDAGGRAEDLRFLEMNPAFGRQTGLVNTAGRRLREVVPEVEERWTRVFAEVALSGEPRRFVDYSQALARWFDVYAFRTGEPGEHRIAVLFNDVSERKQIEAALREADARKNRFLATLSHELRNPLSPIKTGLDVLERVAPGSKEARRAQEIITRQVDQLTHLVDDLLDLTRITRDKIQLQRRCIELTALVTSTLDDHRALLSSAALELTTHISAAPVYIDADPSRVAQVLSNLLQNVAKFTPPGGQVSVSVEVDRDAQQAVVRVRDTGAGLSAKMREQIFRPFMQADTTLDRSQGGLGLGLALVKGLVEQHGGSVDVASEGPGRGSEFIVRLPLASADLVCASDASPREPSRGRRILVIEDNVDAADLLKEVLELTGHTVEVAYDGVEGFSLARAGHPDVVFCDIGLPRMNGYEVARRIRAEPALRDTPLIALSGYALPEDREKARASGFDRHLKKPPNLDDLSNILATLP